MAGGVARRTGIDVTLVRIALVVATLAGGFGAVLYVAGWLVMPLEGRDESVATRVLRDRYGIVLSLAFVPALVLAVVIGSALRVGLLTSFAWPFFACAAGGVLLWRNSDAEERAWLREAAEPVVRLGTGPRRSRRALALRVGGGFALLAVGLAVLVALHPTPTSLLRPVGGALLVIAAFVVLFGPWWLRLVRDLVAEREARTRAQERSDMAARVHDSVLQTLALIQRSADEPAKVVQLARAQERELRAWLFDDEPPGAAGSGAGTVAAGVRLLAAEVEAGHGVTVDTVTVGDCPLDARLRALLGAAREAIVNAAKWSGAPQVSVFAEVEPTSVAVYVRDRGCGFDPVAVADDRRGIAESIHARMLRHGGRASVRTAPGEGTEVELTMPRPREA